MLPAILPYFVKNAATVSMSGVLLRAVPRPVRPIWPVTVAPWQVQVCCLRAHGLYEALSVKGIETLYDDRDICAGAMFSDADLLGAPVRVIVSPKNLAQGKIKIVTRDKSTALRVERDAAVDETLVLVQKLTDEINAKVPARIKGFVD